MQFIILLALVLIATPSYGYYTFRTRIPNGEIVPHPCKANYMWSGVGHENPDGGGDRNPFGRDFGEAGYKWTQELCFHDSDGDGRTNGEELGDPNCMWKEGSVPERVTDISHPGICDPFRQGVCAGRDDYVDCSIERFGESCEVINNADVMSMDYRFKEFEIPNTETNYYCQYFDLPTDADYHVVANEGIIDNHDIVHHMILFACPDDYESSPTDDSPNLCSMRGDGGRSCNTIISLWSVGTSGTCIGEKMGYKIGRTGHKKVKLEIHYNNPLLLTGYMDTSGVRIYFQPDKEGVQDLATLGIGQTMIQIPPGKSSVSVKGSCPGYCSKFLISKPMYVVATVNHMHYMGRSQRTEVLRNGQLVKVLADDTRYDYDSPTSHKLEEPFEVLPGDEFVTTCTFSSMSKKRWVFYGDATNDEMCFAFIIFYPFDAMPQTKWCPMHGPLSPCDIYARTPKYGCDWNRFTNLSNPEMLEHYMNVEHNCHIGICRPECKEVVEEIKQHPCFGEEMNALVSSFLETYHEGTQFLAKLHSCDGHHDDSKDDYEMNCHRDCGHMCDHIGDRDWENPNGAGSLGAIWMASFLTAVAAILF